MSARVLTGYVVREDVVMGQGRYWHETPFASGEEHWRKERPAFPDEFLGGNMENRQSSRRSRCRGISESEA